MTKNLVENHNSDKVIGHNFDFLPAGNYIFKVNNRSTRARCEIFLKLTIKTSKRHDWRRSDVFIVNFKLIHGALFIKVL